MNQSTKLVFLGVLVAFLVAPLVPGLAQIPENSPLILDEPTDIGGAVLSPGVYHIRVVPLNTTRNILQVMSEDKSKVMATVLSVPHALPASERDTPLAQFVFYPATEYSPRALRTWFAPDPPSGGGHDIVYPESRAMELAEAARTRVVAYPGEVRADADLQTATLESVTPDREVQPYDPSLEEREFTTIAESRPPSMAEGREELLPEEERDLPQTAGRGPLLVIVGALSLVVALALRRITAA